jgi:hypothetical protein
MHFPVLELKNQGSRLPAGRFGSALLYSLLKLPSIFFKAMPGPCPFGGGNDANLQLFEL